MTSPKHDEDVRVVEDAAATVRLLRKDRDAQWVAGLRPEDEFEGHHRMRNANAAAAAAAARRRRAAGEEYRNHFSSATTPSRWWLISASVLCSLWVCLLTMRLWGTEGTMAEKTRELEFPPYEFRVWTLLRSILASDVDADAFAAVGSGGSAVTETSKLGLLRYLATSIGVTTVAGLFSAVLNYRLGAATQDFGCFLGFGVAAITAFVNLSTATILWSGCASPSPLEECNTPLISLWVSSLLRWVLPWVSLLGAANLWDQLRSRRSPTAASYLWRLAVGVPLVGYIVAVACCFWVCTETDGTLCGDPKPLALNVWEPSTMKHYGLVLRMLQATELLSVLVATAVCWRVWTQRPLGIVPLASLDDGGASRFEGEYAALPAPRAEKEKSE